MRPDAQPPPDDDAGGGHSDHGWHAGIGTNGTPRSLPAQRPRRRPRYTYRVSWRRLGWCPSTHDKTRLFETRAAAVRFLAKLHGNDRPDLTDYEFVNVDRREVGPWEAHTDLERGEL